MTKRFIKEKEQTNCCKTKDETTQSGEETKE
jgi:hypothetical protein